MLTLPPVETQPVLWLRFTDKASPRIIELVRKRLQDRHIIIIPNAEQDDDDEVILYLTTTQHDLKLEAQQSGLVKPAKTTYIPSSLAKLGKTIEISKAYNMLSRDAFTTSSDKSNDFSGYDSEKLFNSSDRCRLVRSILESITVSDENEKTSLLAQEFTIEKANMRMSFLVNHDKNTLPLEKYHSIYLCDHLKELDIIESINPVHIPHLRDKLWAETVRLGRPIPVQGLRDYYGEKVAYYFAWQEFYMYALMFPGLSGLVINIIRTYRGDSIDDCSLTPFHGLITFIWANVFLKLWSREENRYAFSWGTLNSQTEGRVALRHEFRGEPGLSPVTGEPTRFYSPLKRRLKFVASVFITLVLLSGAFFVMIMSLNLQGYISPEHDPDRWGDGLIHPFHFPSIAIYAVKGAIFDPLSWGSYVPVVLHTTIVLMMNTAYSKVARRLTDWENHETSVSYENSLILKRFFFEAFDAYLILFYLAFYEQDVIKVRSELVALFHVDTFRRIFMEGVVPFVIQKFRNRGKKANISTAKKTDNAVDNISLDEDTTKDEYEEFDDYIESVIQFGYVTLFASAYPAAAFIAVVACAVEYRLDLFKLTNTCTRPNSVLRSDIGIWKHLLKSIVWCSAFTNCLIFAFSSMQMYQYLPGYFTVDETGEHDLKAGNGWMVVFLVFAIERVLMALGILIDLAIPSVPLDVVIKEQRRHFIYFKEYQSSRTVKVNRPQDNPDISRLQSY